jgi:hypothetical protein
VAGVGGQRAGNEKSKIKEQISKPQIKMQKLKEKQRKNIQNSTGSVLARQKSEGSTTEVRKQCTGDRIRRGGI